MKNARFSQRKYHAAIKELAKQLIAWTQREHPTLEDVDVANMADEYVKHDVRCDIFNELLVLAEPKAKARKKAR